MPIAFHLTGGEAGDSPLFKLLLDLGPDVKPRAALADKGYDARANRALARARGIAPAIPFKSSAKDRPAFFPKVLYKGRARIEQCFGKLKRFKRVAYAARRQSAASPQSSRSPSASSSSNSSTPPSLIFS